MNYRLFFKIFVHQLLLASMLVFSMLGLIVLTQGKAIVWSTILEQYFGVPLYQWFLALMMAFSATYALFLSIQMTRPFEAVRAKINWLLLGKYGHEIFEDRDLQLNWYSDYRLLSKELSILRDRFVQLSADLQEFSAAPTFVGEDTREEIIKEERLRIARELHDSVSQQLFAATMLISTINVLTSREEALNPKISEQLLKVEQIINLAQTEMRALLLHLRPIELKDRSLAQGIENMLEELQGKIAVKMKWDLDSSIKLESGIEDHLFRIVQEAVSNTLRHAFATELEVYLTQTTDSVHLVVSDNGRGFQPDEVKDSGNYGLRNMKERISSLGGRMLINSSPAHGTTLDIVVPINLK